MFSGQGATEKFEAVKAGAALTVGDIVVHDFAQTGRAHLQVVEDFTVDAGATDAAKLDAAVTAALEAGKVVVVGENVKVIGGKHAGKEGVIVGIFNRSNKMSSYLLQLENEDKAVYSLQKFVVALESRDLLDSMFNESYLRKWVHVIEYIRTDGEAANGATDFSYADTLQYIVVNKIIENWSDSPDYVGADGGGEPEDIERIRELAQIKRESQMRCVSKTDYDLNTNSECVDILALELDSAFSDGVKDSRSPAQWTTLINRKAKSMKDLCVNAPNENICLMYRDQLMARYMSGLSSK
ncbi:hypothetical protein vBKpnAMK4_00492 [Klebsiella phage vB_Kpn_AM_K4]